MEIAGSTSVRDISQSGLKRNLDVEGERRELLMRRKEADERREQFLHHVRQVSNHIDQFA